MFMLVSPLFKHPMPSLHRQPTCSQTEIVDLVRIFPHEFYKDSYEVVEDKINEKFSDKVSFIPLF